MEIMRDILTLHKLPLCIVDLLQLMPQSADFVRDMVSQQKNVKVTMVIDENLKVIWKKFKTSVTGELLNLVLNCLGYAPIGALKDACMQFIHFVYKGKLYHSREYKKSCEEEQLYY